MYQWPKLIPGANHGQINILKKELNNQAVPKIFYVQESSKKLRTRFAPCNFTESKKTTWHSYIQGKKLDNFQNSKNLIFGSFWGFLGSS